jgi:hypothetical protein
MKTYWDVELDGGEWPVSHLDFVTPVGPIHCLDAVAGKDIHSLSVVDNQTGRPARRLDTILTDSRPTLKQTTTIPAKCLIFETYR